MRIPIEERFKLGFEISGEDDCWEWTRATVDGYGIIFDTENKKCQRAHKLSFTIYRGEIPEGMCVLHTCDNRKCINPNHLYIGTKKNNHDDMVARGRRHNHIGEKHGRAKLSNLDVFEIRRLGNIGVPHKKLAKMFGVAKSNIYYILHNKTWMHLLERNTT